MADEAEGHLSLSAYLTQIQKAFRAAMPDSCWVVAELSDFKRRPNGHCYMDILESRDGNGVAKARCTMFANVAGKVLQQWQEATGGLPQAGMNVLLKVRADFSPQFGFSLMVTGIDPSYTLGDMQAKLQKIISSLRERGWLDLQRGLPAPSGYWRVAVVGFGEQRNRKCT
ncbi:MULTISPECIES: exodeoxyribonuclease VII large subunit [Stutzerimonas]|uniref:exodeoxyribonuclease VII large subunit n=1 Tax=Stutzerimonas TaxID=2901164 RepID=UPI0021AE2666|nr:MULTISPECIES: exodeoxyribonuclease VII large subunit [Stutzerimonas]MDH0084701.1 exodeoxyribonuclease VII large subunit [Stutzerimonas stutzeri]